MRSSSSGRSRGCRLRWTLATACASFAGRLDLSRPDALDEHPATVRLRAQLDRLTPPIDIVDLLAEVQQWTGFLAQLTHAAGATPRMADLDQHLYAALLAAGLNIRPTRMAQCCPLTYRQLAWATEWYLGDDQLQAANDVLVDYLLRLQIAADWGTGTFSSSDGQPSAARGIANLGARPRAPVTELLTALSVTALASPTALGGWPPITDWQHARRRLGKDSAPIPGPTKGTAR